MCKPTIAIIGAGKVGSALAAALSGGGCRIRGVASRSPASARKLAARYGAVAAINPAEVALLAEALFVTTPDDSVAEVVKQIAGKGGFAKGQFVFHTCGALDTDVLLPAKACGAFVGSLHPLQALAGGESDTKLLAHSFFALAGDPPAVELGEKLVRLIGGGSLFIPADRRAVYHAAACVASNYLVALLHAAAMLLHAAGLNVDKGISVLLPLVRGTLHNLERQGTAGALTGPISRGDRATVARHFSVLKDRKEADLYTALARYTIAIARKKGSLSEQQANEIMAAVGNNEPTRER